MGSNSMVKLRITENGNESRNYKWKSFDALANEIVSQWMSSPGHKENILGKDYHSGGIGISTNVRYQVFVTQKFLLWEADITAGTA